LEIVAKTTSFPEQRMPSSDLQPQSVNDDVETQLGPQVTKMRDALARLNDQVITLAKDRPVECLVGAIALGFVFGKLASRI
jgi:hypothetical protein